MCRGPQARGPGVGVGRQGSLWGLASRGREWAYWGGVRVLGLVRLGLGLSKFGLMGYWVERLGSNDL